MNASARKGKKHGHLRSLNALVWALIVLAICLSGIAVWTRYTQRQQTASADAVEQLGGSLQSNLGLNESWVPVGNFPQAGPAQGQSRFFCPPCQASCWTHARRRCPMCPFCGLAMQPRGLSGQGVPAGSLVGGGAAMGVPTPDAAASGITDWPVLPIAANAVRPHAERGPCTNCHTILKSVAPRITTAAQKTAPPIPADAVAPTLIKEFGMEVAHADGSGVKITGIMGSSWASKADLKAGDIILQCNGKSVQDVETFQKLVASAPPEADAQLKILRSGRTLDFSVMVGEGEMEGFTPIRSP